LESGSATTNGYSSASDYEPSYQSVLNATGCGTLTCLRALPLPELVAATNKSVYSWNPVVDGTFLPDRPSVLIASGRMVRVPLLLGRA
jgi:acetylcholinesterase